MASSPKLDGSSITPALDIEGVRPCKWFGAGLCPGCYSEKLYRVRKSKPGKGKTEKRGLVRLGTYIEILEEDYAAFKARNPTRRYFLITRGLEDPAFYQRLAADPLCLNIQVSVDVLITSQATPFASVEGVFPESRVRVVESGKEARVEVVNLRVVPGEERLRWFVENVPKAVFRLKTLAHDATDTGLTGNVFLRNVEEFIGLAERVAIPKARVLETPLRMPGQVHVPHQRTPLEEAGWSTKEYNRCNSPCNSCRAENGFLACAVTPKLASIVASLQPEQPRRATDEEVRKVEEAGRLPWSEIVREAFAKLGGAAETRQIYAAVEESHQEVAVLMFWKTRVRQSIQRVARLREDRKTWEVGPTVEVVAADEAGVA